MTPWQKLRKNEITCEEALQLLVNANGEVNLELLDPEVNLRFRQFFRDTQLLPHVIPLLLWRGCYYLGSAVHISPQEKQLISDRLGIDLFIIPISEKSYGDWYRLQTLDRTKINANQLINPLTGEIEEEDIAETAKLYLSQAADQIERIRTIISSALRNRASDIHLEPNPEGLRIRYRIDGMLRHITTLSPEISRKVIVSLKVMCNMDIAESRVPQDGRIGEKYLSDEQHEQGLDLRVSTLPCISNIKGEVSEKAVLRLLRQQNSFQNIEDLGFSKPTLRIYEHWLSQPQGMIIFTGPTGSGKTSTLYTSLQTILKESVNIVTVENPVEYILPGITQTQVNEIAGMTFAAGLKAILRQDPDIIMVGEIRDQDTAETAIRAALTGHLVLTTLHTNDASGAIPRLKDLGPDPGLICDALLGVIAQRLVRKVCPHCAEPYYPTPEDWQILGLKNKQEIQTHWRKGKGCNKCFNTGYLGREAIVELLNIDDRIRQIIYEGSITQLREYLKTIKFHSFRVAAIQKITQGITTLEEVKRVLPQAALNFRTGDFS